MKSLEILYRSSGFRNNHCVLRNLIYTICLFLCISANGQNIQITGKLLHQESDTVHVQAWHRGHLVADQYRTDPFYTLNLGDAPNYNIVITSGSVQKSCFLICWNMSFELIQLDIDFANSQWVVVYKEKKNAGYYTIIYYGSGNVRQREVKIYETN